MSHAWTHGRTCLFHALSLALIYAAWLSYGGQGVLLAAVMLSFWVLLHFTKIMRLLRAAAKQPLGYCRDCRALGSKLSAGMPLYKVVQHSHSLGYRQDSDDPTIDRFVWEDPQGWRIDVALQHGRLTEWTLHAPPESAPQS